MSTDVAAPIRTASPGRIRTFLDSHPDLPTPFLVLDLDEVAALYGQLTTSLPVSSVLFATKANPDPAVLQLLIALGAGFDVASPGEIDLCLRLGADPGRLSYGNTIKKESDIAEAYRRGIRCFTVDSAEELDKVLRHVRRGSVFVRIVTDGSGADWPLSGKFGCSISEALPLLIRAGRAGLAVGVAFHVGSQQRDPLAWDRPLGQAAALLRQTAAQGFACAGVNIGGGLPSSYRTSVPEIAAYGETIDRLILRHFGPGRPPVTVEPGRYLVGDAGVIQAEVVLITRKHADPRRRWVYLDIGLFNGLTEALNEAIRYRIRVPGRGGPSGPVVLAGPTCDSTDVLYDRSGYHLPLSLQIGDRVELLSTGAYTSTYSSVWFNGFEPLRTYHLPASAR